MFLGLIRASHPLPTAAMTVIVTLCAVSLGWRIPGVLGVALAVLLGQVSVGWSNDAFDADLDRRSGRRAKPVVVGSVTARLLWTMAVASAAACVVASVAAAGLVGGAFHVVAVAAAWSYNLALSRTTWSWLPYAIAFGCIPGFLTWGLDQGPPPAWMVVTFALVGVSAHLANALTDLESDRSAGVGGAAVHLGAQSTVVLGWSLLGAATTILAATATDASLILASVTVVGYAAAVLISVFRPGPQVMFRALVAVTALDVVVLLLLSQTG